MLPVTQKAYTRRCVSVVKGGSLFAAPPGARSDKQSTRLGIWALQSHEDNLLKKIFFKNRCSLGLNGSG